jgi:hypothetical protein
MDKSSPILITGSGGFVGRNLVETLKAAGYTALLCFEKEDTPETLAEYCRRAAFVIHLAGINRPKDPGEFYTGNAGLTETLLADLEAAGSRAPVLVTSSTQAALDNDYGKSKAGGRKRHLRPRRKKRQHGVRVPHGGRVRQVVPPQLQQRGGDLLLQRGARPAPLGAGSGVCAAARLHRRRGAVHPRRDGRPGAAG